MEVTIKDFFEKAKVNVDYRVVSHLSKKYKIVVNQYYVDRNDKLLNIIKKVEDANNMANSSIYNLTNKRDICDPRAEAMYILSLYGFQTKEIGYAFKKDHSTVIYHRDKVKDFISINAKYKSDFYKKYSHILESFQIVNN